MQVKIIASYEGPDGARFSPGEGRIPEEIVAYFRANQRDQFHDVILRALIEQKKIDPSLTEARIAHRLNRPPAQIHQWLASSSNLESDTISDLLLAIGRALSA